MKLIGLLFLPLMTFAYDRNNFEKTYPRDNAFCQIGNQRIEFMIRGDHPFTDPKERAWGESIYLGSAAHPQLLPITQIQSGTYRFFAGNPSACTKVLGTKLSGDKFALLFQKDNRPHKNKVVIQILDSKTLGPIETIHSDFFSNKASIKNNGFVFNSFQMRLKMDMGKVTMNDKIYLYQDQEFPVWMSYDQNGFRLEPKHTFKNFFYQSFFKTESEFLKATGWNEKDQKFTTNILYVAINHETKSKCILFLNENKKLTGEESWICQ